MTRKFFFFFTSCISGNFTQSLRYSRLVIVVLLFCTCGLFFSQQTETLTQSPPATIVLKNGAKLHSTDEKFNQQVFNRKIIIKNSEVSIQDSKKQKKSLKAKALPAQEGKEIIKKKGSKPTTELIKEAEISYKHNKKDNKSPEVNISPEQEGNEALNKKQSESATIIIKNGATLYSADNSFNQQVLNHKVIVKNSEVTYDRTKKNEKILNITALRAQEGKGNDLKKQIAAAEEVKENDSLQKDKKEIDKYEKKKKAFLDFNFDGLPSSSQFFSSNIFSKNYIGPSDYKHDFSKLSLTANYYTVKKALDFLHAQKYSFYNSKSLDFCFSEVFSVRPPPSLS